MTTESTVNREGRFQLRLVKQLTVADCQKCFQQSVCY